MTKKTPAKTTQAPRSHGTAVLGRVMPELVMVCWNAHDTSLLAKAITSAILGQFTMENLQASGMLGTAFTDEE